jgi:mannose/fructose/N-acetylgalactosamine-specific phosphotransferase system component IID
VSLRNTFFVICLIISALCLAAGYGIAGQWIGAMIAILIGPAWLLARKYPDSQLPLVCLLGSVGFAVAGTLIGSPPFLMIFASAVALAAWDLLYLDSALGNHSSVEQTRHYENKHLQSLTLALGSGLIAALLGRFLKIQIPFLVWMLFITFTLFALDRVWGYIKKTGKL